MRNRGRPITSPRRRFSRSASAPAFIVKADSRHLSMSTGLVIHISSGEDRHTEILVNELIRIGSTEDCDLRLRLSTLPTSAGSGCILELARSDGSYHVTHLDSSLHLTKNGKPLEVCNRIQDGDEARIENSQLALQFFPIRSLPAIIPSSSRETHAAPFIEH